MRSRFTHRRWSAGASAVLLTAALGALSACSEPAGDADRGLPTLTHAIIQHVLTTSGAEVAELSGTLVIEPHGCLTWRSVDAEHHTNGSWIVWPDAASLDADVVLLPSGRHVGQGSRLDVAGAYVTLDQLPGGEDETSYLGEYGRACGADERGVLLILDVAG